METFNDQIKVVFTCLPVVNFSMQQNRVAVIRDFSVENQTEDDLADIKITITPEPDFADTLTHFINVVPAGSTVKIDGLRLPMSTNFFIQLTERMTGCLKLELAADNTILFQDSYAIDILAYDQWAGITVLPEMLSAFIMPNHPVLVPIIKRASKILEQWTGNSSLDEYQSRNPNRVRKQMAAVYTAIAEQNIVYVATPASFETRGQRIRLVDAVVSQKMGNCIDISLLYASCLEAVGIHPLIVCVKNHAFAGGWLIPDTFPDAVTDDISFLTKRTADGINEITLVETTGATQSGNTDFERAVKIADSHLKNEMEFVLAVDVKRSRFAGIRPLPQRILNGLQWEIKDDDAETTDKSNVLIENINPYDLSGISSTVQVSKQLMWERKLLDLSLRNNLLNIRMTKNTLQFISANLDVFEDALAAGDEFRILAHPADWKNPLYHYGIYQLSGDDNPVTELVKSEITQKRLRVYLSEDELAAALTHIYRSSQLSIEENGANTLYIALGLLKWFETPHSERPRYAPILLLPVEIIRKSAAKGYVIRARDEDTIINITLLEMLRQHFGLVIRGLEPLPLDDKGVDVRLIYAIVRDSIRNQRKWDVEEQAILGIFSFNKFIMWNDIHNNNEKLLANKLVSSLVNGRIEWEVNDDAIDAAALDRVLTPADILLPIGADSSQLESIYEAMNDRSYILHGPPGTGKSQTITNIIANALYRGKRVLFVAEKMAALSVVQDRLRNIGLAPFCLELHSNKAQKSAILAQLKEAAETVKLIAPENFKQEAERLHAFRSELNAYVNALHAKHAVGFSLYEAIIRYFAIENDSEIKFPLHLLDTVSPQTTTAWQDAFDALVSVGKTCGHPYSNPFNDVEIAGYSVSLKDEVNETMSELQTDLLAVKSKIKDIIAFFDSDSETLSGKRQTDIVVKILEKLLRIPELTPALLTRPRLHDVLNDYKNVIPHGFERDAVKESVAREFVETALSLPAEQLLSEWNRCENKWFVPKYFGQRKIRKQLMICARGEAKIDVPNVLHRIVRFQNEEKAIAQYADLPVLFGRFARKGAENWTAIEQIIADCEAINLLMFQLSDDDAYATKIKSRLAEQIGEGILFFKTRYENEMLSFIRRYSKIEDNENRMRNRLGYAENCLYEGSGLWFDNAVARLQLWLDNVDRLKDWYQWLLIRNRFERLQLGFVAAEYRQRNIPTEQIRDVFYKGFYRAVIQYIVSHEQALEMFNGKLFNEMIAKYKALTLEFETLSRKELYATLASRVPPLTVVATQNSEVGILQRCIHSNGRGVSIRKLFEQIPTLLSRLCPCMLMSPISVAQYIDADVNNKFDLIVFDEASQVPTAEAIGAIARGKNIVIVGDPKQLPPTNFFSVHNVDEEHLEMEDLESILDDCLSLSMLSKHLLWHYRSKHESLIAFSNARYYDNKLFTFPSPDNIESKVRFIHIQGLYDKGKTRQNRVEAQAVVADVIHRLSDSELSQKSIGVVTFSSVQQTLIEDMISEQFVANPSIERVAYECNEPLFIKNLENVQGDERDVILFSVGYGPDAEGKVSMNFGPLNRAGGERRLNVAVSRARYEMIVYSSLLPDMIDLNRTMATGVAGLKYFLEYAQQGRREIFRPAANDPSSNAIEDVIADALKRRGYEVHTRVGSSGYRIDIGIVDSDNPTRYILGILCDGNNYRQAKTARDREIVQYNALRMLGWNICRIWTMDWWENQQDVLDTVADEIAKAKANQNNPPDETETVVEPEFDIARDLVSYVVVPTVSENRRAYEYSAIPSVTQQPAAFFLVENQSLVLSQIREVIETEAPVSSPLVSRKVLSAWGIVGNLARRSRYCFEALFKQLPFYKETGVNCPDFFWLNKKQYLSYSIYRPQSNRDALDLPPTEIANGIKQILTEQISLPIADLLRATRQLFGFVRSGNNIDAAIYRGINEAVKRNYITVENGKAKIV
jgi:very-short-patch-repair endonuclease